MSDNYSLNNCSHLETIRETLKGLHGQRSSADVKFVVGGVEFYGHRVVMGMCSGFLGGMLKELNSCCCEMVEIIIPEINARDFEAVLRFVYRGEVEVGEEEMGGFFEVGKLLGVRGVGEIINEEDDRERAFSTRLRATDPRPCPKCNKIYRSAHTLRTHLEDKHSSCPGYRCVLCGTVAKSRNSLHSHMSRQHRGISTKDLPVLPMPAPFDPELAARLLGNNVSEASVLDTYLKFISEFSK